MEPVNEKAGIPMRSYVSSGSYFSFFSWARFMGTGFLGVE